MLSPADGALAARDTPLASLGFVLDEDALAGWLCDAMPEAGIRTVEARYLRYKPGVSCTVAYDLLTDRGPRQGYARAVTPAAATAKLAGGLIHRSGTVAFLPFPHDRALPALRRLMDGSGSILSKLLPDRPELWEGDVIALRYKPERRYVARLAAEGQQAVVKCYTAADYERTLRAARALQPREPLRVARRIGRSRRHHIAAFSWVDGHGLGLTNLDEVREAGVALAGLHRQLDPRTVGMAEDPVARLHVAATAVTTILPELEPRAGALVRRIAQSLGTGSVLGLHGDWTPDQVVVHRHGVTVLDLDRAHAGDPAADVGQFAAAVRRAALDGGVAPERAAMAVEELVAGYRSAGGAEVGPRLAAWTAASLVHVAVEPFRHRVAEWPDAVEALLAVAEDTLR